MKTAFPLGHVQKGSRFAFRQANIERAGFPKGKYVTARMLYQKHIHGYTKACIHEEKQNFIWNRVNLHHTVNSEASAFPTRVCAGLLPLFLPMQFFLLPTSVTLSSLYSSFPSRHPSYAPLHFLTPLAFLRTCSHLCRNCLISQWK